MWFVAYHNRLSNVGFRHEKVGSLVYRLIKALTAEAMDGVIVSTRRWHVETLHATMVDSLKLHWYWAAIRNWLGCRCDSLHLFGWENVLLDRRELGLILRSIDVLLYVVAGLLIPRRFRTQRLQLSWITLGHRFLTGARLFASALQILQEIRFICYVQMLLLVHTDVGERYWTAINPKHTTATHFIKLNRSSTPLFCLQWPVPYCIELLVTFCDINLLFDSELRALARSIHRLYRRVRLVRALWIAPLLSLGLGW